MGEVCCAPVVHHDNFFGDVGFLVFLLILALLGIAFIEHGVL